MAKEKGLEPLAQAMLSFKVDNFEKYAASFIDGDSLPDMESVLQGARDIIAENISERADIRQELRSFYLKSAKVCSKVAKGKDEEGEKYGNYFNFSEEISRMPAHRLLAILRGEQEGILQVKLEADAGISKKIINRLFYKGAVAAEKVDTGR